MFPPNRLQLKVVLAVAAIFVFGLVAAMAQAKPAKGPVGAQTTSSNPQTFDDEFNGSAVDLSKWWVYNGPGNEGNGTRSPSAITESGGAVTLSCSTNAVCAGMMARLAQKYGTWAARVKMTPASANVHPVLLLWPYDDKWPQHGEVDYMEISDPTRQLLEGYLHWGAANNQDHASVPVDLTNWHVISVTWTPYSITYYVDGRRWFQDSNRSHLPPVKMNATIQIDDAGGAITQGGTMSVDWLHIYQH